VVFRRQNLITGVEGHYQIFDLPQIDSLKLGQHKGGALELGPCQIGAHELCPVQSEGLTFTVAIRPRPPSK
jgi:hypothetical protein